MARINFIFGLISLLLLSDFLLALAEKIGTQEKSFGIDYDKNTFLLDGKPFRYVSGSFHYFRAPHQKWREILRKMRAGGLNAVSTYVEWSMHEPEPGQWNWEGDADIVKFIKIAQEEDLLVILRPGPYICAERDFGGFPYWLLNLYPDIKLRGNDERYIKHAKKFIDEILKKTKPLFRGNGGPIIMVQVENEYGSFKACDNHYKQEMYNKFNQHVGKNALLFTTDGAWSAAIKCGSIPGVYATVDFGHGTDPFSAFREMRRYTPKGPLVNSEYYPGWLSHWNEPFSRVDGKAVARTFDHMLALNASVNFYMYFGGTNFEYSAGANIGSTYQPDLTSYDYDAPLDEAGDPTPKYFELRDVIKKYLPVPNLKTPTPNPKGEYGAIEMSPMLALLSEEGRKTFGIIFDKKFVKPPTFEALGLRNYLVLYEAQLPKIQNTHYVNLTTEPKDRALVYVDNELVGALNRMTNKEKNVLIKDKTDGNDLKILVETMGRVNFGNIDVEDYKGFRNNVYYGDHEVHPWYVTGFKFDSVRHEDFKSTNPNQPTGLLIKGPQLLSGHFELADEPLDTYLNTAGWGKGVAFVNGHNLGRYWPKVGPQVTLYVPSAYLKKGMNNLVLLELEYVPENRKMNFQKKAILDYANY